MAKSPCTVAATANDLFDQFMSANTLKGVVTNFRRICQLLGEDLTSCFLRCPRRHNPDLQSPTSCALCAFSVLHSSCENERLMLLLKVPVPSDESVRSQFRRRNATKRSEDWMFRADPRTAVPTLSLPQIPVSVCLFCLFGKTLSHSLSFPPFHPPVTPFFSCAHRINGTRHAQICNRVLSLNSIRPLKKVWQALTSKRRTGKHKVSSVKLIEKRVIEFTTSRSIMQPAVTEYQWHRFPGQDKSQGRLHTRLTAITAVTRHK